MSDVTTALDSPTLAYYEDHAAAFVGNTLTASMDEAITAFAALLPAGGTVLDWGCGSGRDSVALRDLGFVVTSTDASPAMCKAAMEATGIPARCESFEELAEVESYDGIWACASLLHVWPGILPDVLERAATALKPGGVLYCSFKYGDYAGYRNGRWFTDLDEDTLTELLAPRFDVVRLWVSDDVRPGRSSEPWLNGLATKR